VALAFLLLNIEIADFFTPAGSRALTLEFSGSLARDLAYTIGWSLFALALLVAGIWKKIPAARYAALALLAVVAAKLLLHDLAKLETLYRVAALFGVAVIMILASFLYQKYLSPRRAPAERGAPDSAATAAAHGSSDSPPDSSNPPPGSSNPPDSSNSPDASNPSTSAS
jgi:uncharacterized membrane protein